MKGNFYFNKLFICFFLTLSGIFVHAQSLPDTSDKKITLRVQNVPLKEIFKSIRKQTGLYFMGSHDQLNLSERISISVKDERIEKVLNEVLVTRGYTWSIKDNIITIFKEKSSGTPSFLKKQNLVPSSDTLVTIKGTVSSEDGFFLPGATIQVKLNERGTTTNSNGQFILTNIRDRSVISISYTGYETQEHQIKGSEIIVTKLKRTIGALDETVVIAYGTSKRRILTGSVSRITSKDIETQPISNPLQALQGRMAGVNIIQNSGIPGGNFTVQIRGQNSLRNTFQDNGNSPLYIVDGVVFNSTSLSMTTNPFPNISTNPVNGISPLNGINPSDIESIEVLKDADATAIYGSRGANGVIIITTKKGKAGQMQLDFNAYTGISKVTRKLSLLNTAQYLDMRREAYNNSGLSTYPSNAYDINGTWDQSQNTDWQDFLIGGTARSTDAQLGISGGSDNIQYRVGSGYHKETTVFPGNFSDQRASFHMNLSSTSTNKRFRTELSINYSYSNANLLSQDLTRMALTLAPNTPSLLDKNGNLLFPEGIVNNPLSSIKRPYDNTINNLIGNYTLGYKIFKDITAKLSVGYTSTKLNETNKMPKSSYSPAANIQNTTSFGNGNINSWIIEPQIDWQRNFAKNKFSILIGSTFQHQVKDQILQSASGFLSELQMGNIAAATANSISSTFYYNKYRYSALFGRFTYNHRGRYLINLTGRRDGSSRFGPGRQFANFGAIGAAWIFSEENFLKGSSGIISFGKFRGSIGTTGSDQIGDYQFLDTYTNFGQYQGVPGFVPTRLFNPDFAWETNKKIEIALELGLFRDHLFVEASYYRNRSSNQLVGFSLPPTTGFPNIQANLPAVVQNTGLELLIRTSDLSFNKITWAPSFNITFPRNKLVAFPNIEKSSSYANKYVVGEPLMIVKSYEFEGVDTETGLYKIRDANNNGQIGDIGDLATVNFTGQRFFGGFSNNIMFGGFSISFSLQFIKQKGENYLSQFNYPGIMENQPVEVLERWRKPGDVTNIQKFGIAGQTSTAYSRLKASNSIFTDASFARLKNAHISYQLPQINASGFKFIKKADIFIQGQNLLTFTKYKGLDPENQRLGLPPLMVLTIGINVSLY